MNLDAIPFAPARYQSPASGQPRLIVIHSMECPIEAGRARSVAQWFSGPSSPQASAHYMVDPAEVWCGVRPPAEAWHCGGANRYAGGASIGIEQTGYAAYDAEWLGSPEALAQLDRMVDLIGSLCDRYGIDRVWLSAEQLRAGASGITTHGFLSSIGMGTDHWDPGPNWPAQEFMRRLVGAPTPSGDDDMNVWLMRANNSPDVWVVQANLAGRWHLPSPDLVAPINYVISQGGGKVLTPPADTKPDQLGPCQVWVVQPAFLRAIPITK